MDMDQSASPEKPEFEMEEDQQDSITPSNPEVERPENAATTEVVSAF